MIVRARVCVCVSVCVCKVPLVDACNLVRAVMGVGLGPSRARAQKEEKAGETFFLLQRQADSRKRL